MPEDSLGRGLPPRIPLGFGGLAQLLALAATRPLPIADRPAVAATVAGVLACATFLACGLFAQRGISGPARLVWAVSGSFWAGFGFWLVSVPFSMVAPFPPDGASLPTPAFVYPFPLTYEGFDVAQDLEAILFLSLSAGLLSGGAGLLVEEISARRGSEGRQREGSADGEAE